MRESTLQEYALWYLGREALKSGASEVPADPAAAVQTMWRKHAGKMRHWFQASTRWSVISLEVSELADLVFLQCDWTEREGLVVADGLNYRLLNRVAENARKGDYFTRPPTNEAHAKHQAYYQALASGSLRLNADDRLAVCTAEESEIAQNPRARYYLLGGVGRGLPYLLLTIEHAIKSTPVEAFLAES